MNKTNASRSFQIDPWQQIAFDAITANSDSICLIPCRAGDESSACICVGRVTDAGMQIMPLFVAMTPGLNVTFPDRGEGQGGGGGPVRNRDESPARAFAINKATVTQG